MITVTRALQRNTRHKQGSVKFFSVGKEKVRRERWRAMREEGPLAAECKQQYDGHTLSAPLNQVASVVEKARTSGIQIPPFTSSLELTEQDAAQVAASSCSLRNKQTTKGGSRIFPIGRKIGFTNKNIWAEYNIDAPVWGYMYNETVVEFPTERANQTRDSFHTSRSKEPKIEPEIVFCMKQTPTPSMSDEELLSCISWVGHGYEVVESLYPNWKFTALDTTIAGGLHRAYLLDNSNILNVSNISSRTEFLSQLQNFEIDLFCNGKLVDKGKGSNVLGSPIKALRHLVELLAKQTLHPQIMPGEVITTGTLTKALPINDGDVWDTHLRGIDLKGYRVRFKLTDSVTPTNQFSPKI